MTGNSTRIFNCPKIKTAVNWLGFKSKINDILADIQSVDQQEITILAVIHLVNLANEIQDQRLINNLIENFTSHKKSDDCIALESLKIFRSHVLSLCTNLDNSYRNRVRKSTVISTIQISDVEGKRTLRPSEWRLAGPTEPEIDKEVRSIIRSHTDSMKKCLEALKAQCELKLCN